MSLDWFFEKFELIADLPNAVGRIRELVVQLSVRGRLSRQSGKESCEAQLLASRAFVQRKTKPPELEATEAPFPIPENWRWIAIGHAMSLVNGIAFKPENWTPDGTPIVRIQNLNNPEAPFNRFNGQIASKFYIDSGDFLISWSGTPGTSFGAFIWNRGKAILNQHIFRCELPEGVFVKEYLRLAVNARLDEMISLAHGAVGLRHITKGKLETILLPLPPLAEQKRIVAKVDELMALCDQLEAQQQEREARKSVLARAALSRFAAAPTPANLRFLFHNSYDIPPADLRKAILTLAVDGILVRRGPKEPLATTVRVGEVVTLLGGYAFKSEWFTESQGVRLVRNQNISHGELDWNDTEYLPSERAGEFERWALRPGDLVLSLNRPFISTGLKLAWITEADCPCLLVQRVACLRPTPSRLLAEYLYLWCNAPHFYRDAHVVPSSGVPYIAPNRIAQMKMHLPPLVEQLRIVEKVDQLMSLVDALEQQLKASRVAATKLLTALVAELTEAQTR
jgi:type I restriction enzyme S subunit